MAALVPRSSSCRPSWSRWLWRKESPQSLCGVAPISIGRRPMTILPMPICPLYARMGLSADAELKAWGWYPAGGGEVMCMIKGGRCGTSSRLAAADRGARAWASPSDHRPSRRRQPPCSHRPTHVRPGAGGAERFRRPGAGRAATREGGLPRGRNFSHGRVRDLGGEFLRPWAAGKAVRSRCRRGGCRFARASCLGGRRRIAPCRPASAAARQSPPAHPYSPWRVRPRTSPPMPGRSSSLVLPKSRPRRATVPGAGAAVASKRKLSQRPPDQRSSQMLREEALW